MLCYNFIVIKRGDNMYLKEYLEQFGDKKIKLFVDMDGVVADYIFGSAQD